MSLLTLIQTTAQLCKLTVPTVVETSTDTNILLLLALANESGKALAKRYDWQELTYFTNTILAGGSIDIGSITTCFGSQFDRVVNQTFWDISTRLPIDGPTTMQQWQQYQASNVVGPPYQFIVFSNRLKVGPTALASGDALTAYCISKYWCQSAGGTGQTSFAADSDIVNIPEDLFSLDIRWRFKSANGLSYGEDLQTAEQQIETYIGQNTPSKVLFLGGRNIFYNTNIPEGFWPG